MKIAIVDGRIQKDTERALSRYADRIVKLPPFSRLQTPVSSHPDMLLFITDEEIITNYEYRKENRELFGELSRLSGLRTVTDKVELSPEYPADIAFNCFAAGGRLFGLIPSLSKKILSWAQSNSLPCTEVRQGYAKCSACCVSENAVITEDPSIEKAMVEHGIDVLKVSPGHVILDGYDRGFIGGACGSDTENVYFCGNVSMHPDHEKIEKFCAKHGKGCISLGHSPLYDLGTVFFIES